MEPPEWMLLFIALITMIQIRLVVTILTSLAGQKVQTESRRKPAVLRNHMVHNSTIPAAWGVGSRII